MHDGQKKKRILIVHGWMHSAMRYRRLKQDLERFRNCEVELYEFPGFGNTPIKDNRKILENYVADMGHYLQEHEFDGIIAHSMGGNVALKAVAGMERKPPLLLLSPVYKGVSGLTCLLCFYPLLEPGIWLCQQPLAGSRILLKAASLFTINRWKDIDKRIILDARKADRKVAVRVLFELVFDRWTAEKRENPNQVLLLLGQKDRVIRRKQMAALKQDLGGCQVQVLKGVGHTAVVEDYKGLVRAVLDWLL